MRNSHRCLTRFKNVVAIYPRLVPLIRNLESWVITWTAGISAVPAIFDDPFKDVSAEARDHVIHHLKGKVIRMITIVDREQGKLDRASQKTSSASLLRGSNLSNEGIIAALRTTYDGPGTDRPEGPRHDNDHLEIDQIRIAPTHEELISRIPPFLPSNFYGAPHPLPPDSMQRLLDIQFRLLREELTCVPLPNTSI